MTDLYKALFGVDYDILVKTIDEYKENQRKMTKLLNEMNKKEREKWLKILPEWAYLR